MKLSRNVWILALLGVSIFLTLQDISLSQAAPLPPIRTLEGRIMPVQSHSKRLLVYVWATWCTTCLEKMTHTLPDWMEASPRGHFDVLLLNTDTDRNRVKHYMNKHDIAFASAQDPQKALVRQIRALSVPHWAVFEQRARGDFRLVDTAGGFDEERVKRALELKI